METGQQSTENPAPTLHLPELLLPKFMGDDPKYWLRKCRCYFALNRMDSGTHRILIASMQLEGAAEVWYALNVEGKESRMRWKDFEEMVLKRFRAWGAEAMVGRRLDTLRQLGLVEQYVCEFEAVQAGLLADSIVFDETRLVQWFIGGLAEPTQSWVHSFEPETVARAIFYARDSPPAHF